MFNPKRSILASWVLADIGKHVSCCSACIFRLSNPRQWTYRQRRGRGDGSSKHEGWRLYLIGTLTAALAMQILRGISSHSCTGFLLVHIFSFADCFSCTVKGTGAGFSISWTEIGPVLSFSGVDMIFSSQQGLSFWRKPLKNSLWCWQRCRVLYPLSDAPQALR